MILVRWSCFGDPTAMTLLWDYYLLELVWWPMIEFTQVKVEYFELEKSYIEYGWCPEHIQKSCWYDWPFFLQGRGKCSQLIKLILWIQMNLLVSYRWWNQRKTYLVIDREYGTNFDVLRSGLRFFDCFSSCDQT